MMPGNTRERCREPRQVTAPAFTAIGLDIDVVPLFQTPEEAARHAIEADDILIVCGDLFPQEPLFISLLCSGFAQSGERAGEDSAVVLSGGDVRADGGKGHMGAVRRY